MSEKHEKITWRAAEHEYVAKSGRWYFWIVLIGILLAIFALFQNNFFFLVFVVLATIVMIAFGRQKPHKFDFTVDDDGFSIGDDIDLPFAEIESFSVRERGEGHLDEIILKRKKLVDPFVRVPLDTHTRHKVVVALEKEEIEEEKQEDSFFDSLADILGF